MTNFVFTFASREQAIAAAPNLLKAGTLLEQAGLRIISAGIEYSLEPNGYKTKAPRLTQAKTPRNGREPQGGTAKIFAAAKAAGGKITAAEAERLFERNGLVKNGAAAALHRLCQKKLLSRVAPGQYKVVGG